MWMWTMNNNEFWIWGGTFESNLKNVWGAYLRILETTKCITRQINLIVCEGAHFIQIHCFKGAHLTLSEIQFKGAHLRILQGAHFNPKKREIATFTWFATKAHMLPAKCASSDSYVPPPMGAVGDTFEDRGIHALERSSLQCMLYQVWSWPFEYGEEENKCGAHHWGC